MRLAHLRGAADGRVGKKENIVLNLRSATLPAFQVAAVTVILGVVAVISLMIDEPILVPSLAACTFLQLLLPDIPAAKPWAVVAGQLVGLASGTSAVVALGVDHAPAFAASYPLDIHRAAAAVLAAAVTLAAQQVFRAGNAAGAALAVTIALGDSSANLSGLANGVIGILVVAILGEAARRIVLHVR